MIVLTKTLRNEQSRRHEAELRAIEAERRADEAKAALHKLQAETLACSFCGKNFKKVRKLIAGPRVFICNECVDLCVDILAEEAR